MNTEALKYWDKSPLNPKNHKPIYTKAINLPVSELEGSFFVFEVGGKYYLIEECDNSFFVCYDNSTEELTVPKDIFFQPKLFIQGNKIRNIVVLNDGRKVVFDEKGEMSDYES